MIHSQSPSRNICADSLENPNVACSAGRNVTVESLGSSSLTGRGKISGRTFFGIGRKISSTAYSPSRCARCSCKTWPLMTLWALFSRARTRTTLTPTSFQRFEAKSPARATSPLPTLPPLLDRPRRSTMTTMLPTWQLFLFKEAVVRNSTRG